MNWSPGRVATVMMQQEELLQQSSEHLEKARHLGGRRGASSIHRI